MVLARNLCGNPALHLPTCLRLEMPSGRLWAMPVLLILFTIRSFPRSLGELPVSMLGWIIPYGLLLSAAILFLGWICRGWKHRRMTLKLAILIGLGVYPFLLLVLGAGEGRDVREQRDLAACPLSCPYCRSFWPHELGFVP